MLLTKKDVKLRKVIETDGKGIDLVMIKSYSEKCHTVLFFTRCSEDTKML